MREATEAAARVTIRDYDDARAGRVVPRDIYQPLTTEMRDQLRQKWPNGALLTAAMRLAKDPETCAALLQGHPVDPARINKDALERALEASLVQLVRPIDVLHGRAA